MKIADFWIVLQELLVRAAVGPPSTVLALLAIRTADVLKGHTFAGAPGEHVSVYRKVNG